VHDVLGFMIRWMYDPTTGLLNSRRGRSGQTTTCTYYVPRGPNDGILYFEAGPTGKKSLYPRSVNCIAESRNAIQSIGHKGTYERHDPNHCRRVRFAWAHALVLRSPAKQVRAKPSNPKVIPLSGHTQVMPSSVPCHSIEDMPNAPFGSKNWTIASS
jgi:hypothetical protein